MANIKNRTPDFHFTEDRRAALAAFDKISKADWCDLYFDLYRQVFGETAPGEDVLADIAERIEILRNYRKAS